MAPGETNNKPNPASPEQPSNPIDQALEAFKQKKLSHTEIVGQLESLKQQVQQENTPSLSVQNIPALREAVVSEVDSGGIDSLFTDAEQKNTLLADLDKRLDEIEQIVQQKATAEPASPEPSLLSKEGMKKALDDGIKNLGVGFTTLVAVLDQIKEQISITIGAHLETLASFIKPPQMAMLKGFIGEDRIHLSATLGAAKIALPMPAFIFARKKIDAVRRATSAASRNWNAENMSFFLVEKLALANVTGTEDAGVLEQRINDAAKLLEEEIRKSPVSGSSVDFVDAGTKPVERMKDTLIANKKVDIMSDGSMTVAGQKWRLELGGQKLAVKTAVFENNALTITTETYRNIVVSENLDTIVNDLALAGPAQQKIAPANDKGEIILEFIRTS